MKKTRKQDVCVAKAVYEGTYDDYLPVQYEIHVDETTIIGITEESARYIHERLSNFLSEKKGGQS